MQNVKYGTESNYSEVSKRPKVFSCPARRYAQDDKEIENSFRQYRSNLKLGTSSSNSIKAREHDSINSSFSSNLSRVINMLKSRKSSDESKSSIITQRVDLQDQVNLMKQIFLKE